MRRQSIRAMRQQEQETASEKPGEETSAEVSGQITVEPQNSRTLKPQTANPAEEKATEKLTLYLLPRQRDKLDELIMGYRRETGKRITHNKMMRMLIDKAELTGLI